MSKTVHIGEVRLNGQTATAVVKVDDNARVVFMLEMLNSRRYEMSLPYDAIANQFLLATAWAVSESMEIAREDGS